MKMTYQGTSFPSSLTNHASWRYDVFLSFRGEDTRNNFTGHLYHALLQRGINTFMDDGGLRLGEEISQSLLKAIEESRISIIVFSETYASSTWCLDELVKILECRKVMGQLVRPVFHGITPSDVRHQKAGYEKAMEKHEQKFKHNLEKVQNWRLALNEASSLAGWHFKDGYEYEFIQRIIDEISSTLNCDLLHVADYPVGLESRILELQTLLDIGSHDCVQMVGICGLGGIGKSTIARALCNLIACHFERTCYLANVRENSIKHGLVHLQETLLSDLVGKESIKIHDVHKGIPIIKSRLSKKMVLLVLDDVDKLEQLQTLAGGTDWFSFGSRVIVTTRDKHLLVAHQVEKIFEVGKLTQDEALELFSWNAFRKRIPAAEYVDVSNRVIHYANGLPLALKIIGSDLFGKRVDEWENVLEKYRRIPKREIFSILKVSYDNLEDDEKEVFLDIACLFNGEGLEYVKKVLNACGFNPNYAIGVLVDKSLMAVSKKDGRLWMHDLVQDMGREIVRQESPKKPGKRTRLWFHEDVLQVLQDNTGTDKIEAIMLESPQLEEVDWSGNAFIEMKNLRILVVRNGYFSCGPKHLPNSLKLLDWKEYPSSSLPPDFHARKLAVLSIPHSNLKLEKPFKKFENLTYMNLSRCESLVKVPDVSGIPNLRELNLYCCKNLVEVDDSVGFLDKLVELSVGKCTQLRTFPHSIKLTSLHNLNLRGCLELKRFPDVLVKTKKILTIDIAESGIEEIPFSIGNLIGIVNFNMSNCKSLRHIPHSIGLLQNLLSLNASSCPQLGNSFKSYLQMRSTLSADDSTRSSVVPNDILSSTVSSHLFELRFVDSNLSDEDLPLIFGCFTRLTSLHLSRNNFKVLPKCIINLAYLDTLDLDGCEQLQDISIIPPSLQNIRARYCTSLTSRSQGILLSQVFCKTQKLDIVMPALTVPEWFDHISIDGHISFWFRNYEFPDVAVCFVLGIKDDLPRDWPVYCELRFLINGYEIFKTSKEFTSALTLRDHLWLFDLRASSLSFWWRDIPFYILHEWNRVQVSCEFSEIRWCGVYVNKKATNMQDILFRNPYPQDSKLTTSDSDESSDFDEDVHEAMGLINECPLSKRIHEDSYNSEGNVESYGYPLHRRRCVYGITSAFETMDQQQQSTSTHQIFKELILQQNKGFLPSSSNQMDNVNQDQTACSNQQLYSKKHVEDMVGCDDDGWIADINGDEDTGQQLFKSGESILAGNNLKDLFTCTVSEGRSRESPLCSLTQHEESWDPMELEYKMMSGNDQLGQDDKCQNKDEGRGMMGTQDDKRWNF